MKLLDKIAMMNGLPFYTFELFPPTAGEDFDVLLSRLPKFAELNPASFSVTWGAGGAPPDRSLELAMVTQSIHGVATELHLTCTNLTAKKADSILRIAKDENIHNIFALRGDPPQGQEHWTPSDPHFVHGIDLVKYIRASPEFSSHFCIRVGAYPDRYPDTTETLDEELQHLKEKVDAGADYIVTQLFYDVDRFLYWQEKVREKGIMVPIIPGVLPIHSCASFERVRQLTQASVLPALETALKERCHDDQLVEDFGVEYAIDTIKRLISEGSVPGIYFCTLNLETSVQRILEGLGWVQPRLLVPNELTRHPTDQIALSPHVTT